MSLLTEPCECCRDLRYVKGEPPYYVCGLTGDDSWECAAYLAALAYVSEAERLAEAIALVADADLRTNLAAVVADAVADAMYDLDGHPSIDPAAYAALVAKLAAAPVVTS